MVSKTKTSMEIKSLLPNIGKFKVVKRSTLFPLEPDFKQLDLKRCPLCSRKYKVMRSGDIYCNKHTPNFFMRKAKIPLRG